MVLYGSSHLSVQLKVLVSTLHSPQFIDKAPAAVYAELLDEGRYLSSIRTMYRLLSLRNEVRER